MCKGFKTASGIPLLHSNKDLQRGDVVLIPVYQTVMGNIAATMMACLSISCFLGSHHVTSCPVFG